MSYCQARNIALEAYSPLVQGKKASDATLTKIAKETGKTWAQVLIRWSLQRGWEGSLFDMRRRVLIPQGSSHSQSPTAEIASQPTSTCLTSSSLKVK